MNRIKAIIMAILGGLGVLFIAIFKSTRKENKELKTQVKAQEAVKATQEQLIKDVKKKPPTRSRREKTKGVIKGLAFACVIWSATACAPTAPKPLCPTLITVERPDFMSEIPYEYNPIVEAFTLQPNDLNEMIDQLNWARYAIGIYEAQIQTYTEWCNGTNK